MPRVAIDVTQTAGRVSFGPPKPAVGAFLWSALQLPRAWLWQFREKDLRALAMGPAVITFVVGAVLIAAAVGGAGPLQDLWTSRGTGLVGGVTWLAERVLLTVVLVIGAAMITWQLQGAIASASLERMALYVQRVVQGDAPAPTVGALEVVRRAALGFLPRVGRLVVWLLSTAVALTLVLVPVIGPVLVVVAQTCIASLFLAHGAIADNRERLGLPRRLLLREPALVLGLAVAFVPLILVPPLMLVSGGPVAIAGALVALGSQRRQGLAVGTARVSPLAL